MTQKTIAYVQPIFAPDKMRLDRNLDSLYSMSEYLHDQPYDDIEFHFGGWANEEYWPTITEVITQEFDGKKFIVKKFDKNYGKGRVVNTLTKDIDTNYILTADSDILFIKTEEHMFERLVNAAEISPTIRGKPFGMLALNQQGHNCHLPFCYDEKVEYDNKFGKYESLCFPHGKGGIAGGCIFFPNNVWKELSGYREGGVYFGDDAYFLVDVYNSGRTIQILQTCNVIHPSEHDPIYAKWKVYVCLRDADIKNKLTDEKIEEAETFWKSRNA